MKYLILLILLSLSISAFSQFQDSTKATQDSSEVTVKADTLEDFSECIIRKAIIYSGKRPSEEEIKNTKAKLWLIRIYFKKGKEARSLMLLERDGKKFYVEYVPIRTFESEDEAIDYAKENDIKDVELK